MKTAVELPLRDELALTRTELANRRTWLAYARTALALFVSGASFLQFFDQNWTAAVGVGFMIAAVPVAGYGYWRGHDEGKRLKELAEDQRKLIAENGD